jgi:DNA-binding NarL/FixJ family response regulator
MELLGMGLAAPQIARKLSISDKAVSSHLDQMRSKLGLANENELIRYAVCWVENADK